MKIEETSENGRIRRAKFFFLQEQTEIKPRKKESVRGLSLRSKLAIY